MIIWSTSPVKSSFHFLAWPISFSREASRACRRGWGDPAPGRPGQGLGPLESPSPLASPRAESPVRPQWRAMVAHRQWLGRGRGQDWREERAGGVTSNGAAYIRQAPEMACTTLQYCTTDPPSCPVSSPTPLSAVRLDQLSAVSLDQLSAVRLDQLSAVRLDQLSAVRLDQLSAVRPTVSCQARVQVKGSRLLLPQCPVPKYSYKCVLVIHRTLHTVHGKMYNTHYTAS